MKRLVFYLSVIIISLTSTYGQTFDLDSDTFKIGDKYIVEPYIFFDFAKWTIRQESYSQLDRIVEFLKENNAIEIEIGYHLDSRISDSYSIRLDIKRAESISEYLISKGIIKERLQIKGYLDTEPLITDKEIERMKTEDEKDLAHFKNRRTELKIISLDFN